MKKYSLMEEYNQFAIDISTDLNKLVEEMTKIPGNCYIIDDDTYTVVCFTALGKVVYIEAPEADDKRT